LTALQPDPDAGARAASTDHETTLSSQRGVNVAGAVAAGSLRPRSAATFESGATRAVSQVVRAAQPWPRTWLRSWPFGGERGRAAERDSAASDPTWLRSRECPGTIAWATLAMRQEGAGSLEHALGLVGQDG